MEYMEYDINKLKNKVFEKNGIILYKMSKSSYVVKKEKVVITVYIRKPNKIETQRVFIKENGSYIKKIRLENGYKISEYRKLGESILAEYLENKPLDIIEINDEHKIDDFFEDYIFKYGEMNEELFKLKKLKNKIDELIGIVERDIKDRDLQNQMI